MLLLTTLPLAAQSIERDSEKREVLHFTLLGPDWDRIPPGYSGITPLKEVAELNIPDSYVKWQSMFPMFRPPQERTSSIPIRFFYPSMEGAASNPSSLDAIGAVITAGRGKERRKAALAFREGMRREPQLDTTGLCAYVDPVHPGYAGDEFYVACDESEQSFEIICFPPFNNRRVCTEVGFLIDEFNYNLSFQDVMLKEHQSILDNLRKLVRSFVQPI